MNKTLKSRHFISGRIIENRFRFTPTFWNGRCQVHGLRNAERGKGRYTRGSLPPQHAPATRSRSKAPSSAPTISSEKICCVTKFFPWSLLPHIKLVWYEGASSRGKSVARVCFRSKLPGVYWNLLAVTWRVSSWPIKLAYFFSSTTHCELTFIVPMPQSGCFIIQLPRRVLRVYWLGYLPGSVFRERVSGASSLVCTGLNT